MSGLKNWRFKNIGMIISFHIHKHNFIESIAWEFHLPVENLRELQDLVKRWLDRCSCIRHELESLVGCLPHVCSVIKPGKRYAPSRHQASSPSHPSQCVASIRPPMVVYFYGILVKGIPLISNGDADWCIRVMDTGRSHRTYIIGYNSNVPLTTVQVST